MNHEYPRTPVSLLSCLREGVSRPEWELCWQRFLELYRHPLSASARGCYRHHTGGGEAPDEFVEDVVAIAVADFFSKGQQRYDPAKGRLRTYLRVMINARVVDALRKERPADRRPFPDAEPAAPPEEREAEKEAFHQALLATLLEDLRAQIPSAQFEIFERVRLKRESPQEVADELGVRRNVIDKSIHKTMTKLRELARREEYREEFDP